MTRNSRKTLILAILCALFALSAIPGFLINSRNSNINSVKSALLNPKYVPDVNEITISFTYDECESFTFNRQINNRGNGVWICTTDSGMTFPASSTIVNQLINRVSSTVSMAEVSDSYTAWTALGLSDDLAVNISFNSNGTDGSRKTFSSLYFGYENADGSMIYVRSDRKSTSWRITNDYSSYLSQSISSWADQHLLPIGSTDESDASVSRIEVLTGSGTRNMYNDVDKSEQFDAAVHTLLSLRTSEILTLQDFTYEVPDAVPVMKITLANDYQDNSRYNQSYGLMVYEAVFENGTDTETEYYVTNFGIISDDDAQYVLKISSWTFSKILEALDF